MRYVLILANGQFGWSNDMHYGPLHNYLNALCPLTPQQEKIACLLGFGTPSTYTSTLATTQIFTARSGVLFQNGLWVQEL
ncbi:hypothetical protein L202_07950 [Cryptococcus amylolentus CBS 6039]|uniref:Uncharacterized protein n=1 Tax=Cryptococcus amylolentus CBS 6039 TaxID=1295533 RepID=A0A1E3HBA3_9TREE|nr:hypothetical protein L202_07950 [Cryptococcus amylolentus CBS 6039]ODN73425.1 hypothetical protein L202_07950 [Cryptococcus amylolentus CBS 6039]